jgi:hypothetical protein
MAALDAAINSTFIALDNAAAAAAESEIPANTNVFAVVEAEAGNVLIGLGAVYTVRVVVQDITGGIPPKVFTFAGNLNNPSQPPNPPWTLANANANVRFSFPFKSGKSGTIYRVLTILSIGTGATDTNFRESDPVVVV